MKRFLFLFLILVTAFSTVLAQDILEKMIDEGYLPANADGSLGSQEPVDRLTFANALAKVLQEIEKSSPKGQEELLRKLTVELQAELARMMTQTRQFEESLERLKATSDNAQDELVQVTAESQKLSADLAATYSKLTTVEQNLKSMELGYQTIQESLQAVEVSSKNLSGEIEAARVDFQRGLVENQSQLSLIQGQISQAKEISEATFQRQGELLGELEERALSLRQQSQELASLVAALEQRSTQLGGQLENTEAALYENVNKLQLDLSTTIAQLRYTGQKLDLEKQATAQKMADLNKTLQALQAEMDAQQKELAAYKEQNKKWGKLGVAFSAVAIPLFLLLFY